MQSIKKTFVASASELIQHSDLYMTVKTVMFTAPSPNLNGVRCTEGFIDNIIANQDAYIGLPLTADIRSLESGQYNKLGHMFNQTTGTFATSIIGSFYKFEKESVPNGDVALVGYARIMKRNKAVCSAVGELFASGNLKFSFEISCGCYSELEDGTMMIDASDENFLEGMCIVWAPACPEAVAQELVAELNNDGKEAEKMNAEIQESSAEVTTETIEAEEVVAENNTEEISAEQAEESEVSAEEVTTEASKKCKNAEDEETAETEKTAETETETAEEATTETASEETAEADTVNAETTGVEADTTNDAGATESDTATLIAELLKSVNELKDEIRQLKAETEKNIKIDAAAAAAGANNPFMAAISIPEKKYSLLEVEKDETSYSLLEKDY